MNNAYFPQYKTDYISGVLSLRKPQRESLEILHNICNTVNPSKTTDLNEALKTVHDQYPTCTSFERSFLSLTFALATGVGKTRLMGAFITYLYTQHNIHNFFVVAPNTTIFEKLKADLGNPGSSKYVFQGLGCFLNAPRIITDDEYREKQLSLFESDINIFVFNIDKFNKESSKMRKISEYLGQSFYQTLSELSDLVLLMDESHHYHAEKGSAALNELKPILGLELTATPLIVENTKQIFFKNVVYEYCLSKAIEDGYTRTPYAVTRSNVNFYNFGEEQIDKLMLQDGILCHETIKKKLAAYAFNNKKTLVKPFMLVVCKDTDHAKIIESYIKSDEFKEGNYKNKTVIVHSKQKGSESEENLRLLLEVEQNTNPIEIVIHVNMLKEGWDVTNLYTIVPLRTATSKILREQMVGRGLRLPYGERTGETDIDAVMLTAHDKFKELLQEAQRGDSIFKAGNIIKAEDLEDELSINTQLALELDPDTALQEDYKNVQVPQTPQTDNFLKNISGEIQNNVAIYISQTKQTTFTKEAVKQLKNELIDKISKNKDLSDTYNENKYPFDCWFDNKIEKAFPTILEKYIPIPHIKITDQGVEECKFVDFDLDTSEFTQVPIENELLIQNLEDMDDRRHIKAGQIDFEGYNPQRTILELLREKPEIDYEKSSVLINKLITLICIHFKNQYGENGMQNIIMMYKKDITSKLYNQMMTHFYYDNGLFKEEVDAISKTNLQQTYTFKAQKNIYEIYEGEIKSILFTGIKKGVFSSAKFDSSEELVLARIMEQDMGVLKWLRPAKKEFNITYNNGKHYEPDFVVETQDMCYLVEVKGEDRINTPDTIAKKNRAIRYCVVASAYAVAHHLKPWEYLFIPARQILPNATFKNLCDRFCEKQDIYKTDSDYDVLFVADKGSIDVE